MTLVQLTVIQLVVVLIVAAGVRFVLRKEDKALMEDNTEKAESWRSLGRWIVCFGMVGIVATGIFMCLDAFKSI